MDKEFKLEKLLIQAGSYSAVKECYAQSGHASLFNSATKDTTPISNLDQLEVGQQVIVARGIGGWLNTSPIQEILDRGPNYVKFRTKTSVYVIEEL